MKKILFALPVLGLLASSPALAVDGVYLGAEVGAVGGSNGLDTQVGFGGDVGVNVSNLLELDARVLHSSHNGGLAKLTSAIVAADFRLLDMGDFVFSAGAGPGFYFSSTPLESLTKFGLNYGGEFDVVLSDAVHVGVGGRYHMVFSGNDFWQATMRVGIMLGTAH